MTKLLSALIVSLLLLPALLFVPATAAAEGPGDNMTIIVFRCPVTETFSTLPPTDVTDATAVFHGSTCIRGEGMVLQRLAMGATPLVFEYGTEPGVYPFRVSAKPVSQYSRHKQVGDHNIVTVCVTFEASVDELSPCTYYYVRLRFLNPFPGEELCSDIVPARAVEFRTEGCRSGAGSHQAGGVASLARATRPFLMSNIVVKTAALSASRVSPGEKVDVTATMSNGGGSNGTARVTLYVNGREAESKGVTLTSGETTPVHFFTTAGEPGTYQVYVNGTPAGSFTVDTFADPNIILYVSGALLFLAAIIGTALILRRRTTQ